MPDPIDPTAQQVPPPARRPSFAERLKPQRLDLEDVPEPPAFPVEEDEIPEPEKGSADMSSPGEPAATSAQPMAQTAVSAEAETVAELPKDADAARPVMPTSSQEVAEEFVPDPDFEVGDTAEQLPQFDSEAFETEISPALPGAQPDPFALRPEKPESDLTARVFEVSKDGQQLPVPDYETPEELKEASVTRMLNPLLNSISCGDDLHIPTRPKKTLEEELADLGFPPRPHLWPHMMAWPPRRDMELLHKKGLTRETLEEYLNAQKMRQLRMLERCAVINEWLDTYNPDPGFGYRGLDRKSRSQTYGGIQWACLLDEDAAKGSVTSSVMSWGRHRVRTRDGGQVRAHKDFVAVNTITKQALTLALFEARARGWNTLRISGSPEFVKQAMEVCREHNIAAEVTKRVGFHRKVYHVSPTLPGPIEVNPDSRGETGGRQKPLASLPSDQNPAPEGKRLAIPDSGVDGMPRSPFAAGASNMGRDIDDPEDALQEPVSKRLAFGDPLGAPKAREKSRPSTQRSQPHDKEDPVLDV